MITEILNGDILKSRCDAITNTINCVGVMGAGLALQFKRKYPRMFEEYKQACLTSRIKPGDVWLWGRNPTILNVATKNHWKDKSQFGWILLALANLHRIIKEERFGSVAITKLGCGLGGLNWTDVYPEIKMLAEDLPEVLFEVYI